MQMFDPRDQQGQGHRRPAAATARRAAGVKGVAGQAKHLVEGV